MKINNLLFFISCIVLVFSSCNNNSRLSPGDSVVVKDMLGREVKVPSEVKRIIGLRAGALRLLIYMDAAGMIAGVEENEKKILTPYMAAFPELAILPSVGPQMGGDAELIVGVNPDVIFMSYTTVQDADELQKKTGIPVIAIECSDLITASDSLFSSLRLIGKIIGREQRADTIISYIIQNKEELQKRISAIANEFKPLVYVGGLSYSGAYGISSTHPDYAPFMILNASNAASQIDKRLTSHIKGTFVDIEQLLMWNPDYIFIDESGLNLTKDDFNRNPSLRKSLSAYNSGNVYTLLPYNNYATNYEYVLINAWFTANIIYPDCFSDISADSIGAEILTLFYNRKISFDLIKSSVSLQPVSFN
jgi:iron complex transport system substrate-binding protein